MRQGFFAKVASGVRSAYSAIRVYGSGGAQGFSWLNWNLGTLDIGKRLGLKYDNSVVAAGVFFTWRAMVYPRIGVESLGPNGIYSRKPKALITRAIEAGPYYDHTVLFAGTMLGLIIDGNAYWYKARSASGAVVGYLWVPSSRMVPMADKDNPGGARVITYYRYTPLNGSPEEIAPDDVVHFRFGIDPMNPMLGMSPLVGAFREMVGENEASILSTSLMANAGLCGVAISPKVSADAPREKLTPQQREEAQDRFKRNTRGSGAGTPNFFDFPVDVVSLGYRPKDLALSEQQAIFVSRICAGLGFDPMVLGLPSASKTYSNYEEAIQAAWEQTLLPLIEIMGIQLGHQSLGDFPDSEVGDRIHWDLSKVRALQPDLDQLFKRIDGSYVSGWITRAEAKSLALAAGVSVVVDEVRDNVYIQDVMGGGADVNQAAAKSMQHRADLKARMERASEVYERMQAEVLSRANTH